jgi:nicotinamide mononucleotide transporter
MTLEEIYQQFIRDIHDTTSLEYIAVFAGIGSVWCSRIENIWVYPLGLINTIIYIYLSLDRYLVGEASVNFYYTAMSIYGWILWTRKNAQQQHLVVITFSSAKQWGYQALFFIAFYLAIFFSLTYLKKGFASGAIPWADAFASATAYTGMWLMAKKKVESWWWWIGTNIASIPLYFVKHLVLTSIYYLVLLVIAIFGLLEWKKRARENKMSFTDSKMLH